MVEALPNDKNNELIYKQLTNNRMKYTKGIWEYIGHIASDHTHFVRKIMCGTVSICVIRTNNQEQAEANAKLMAASPELLDALIEILPFAEEFINANHPTHKKALAAIKKATV